MKTLLDQANEIKAAIENCVIGIDQTTREGKAKAIIATLDLFAQWQDEEARAYIAALEADPDFDLSPAAFSTTYNRLNQVA